MPPPCDMSDLASSHKTLLATLATLFAAATILYTGVWMYSSFHGWVLLYELLPPPPWSYRAGVTLLYVAPEHSEQVITVAPASPGEKSGLRAGDRIVAINGTALVSPRSLLHGWLNHQNPGDTVDLTIRRANVSEPIVLTVFRSPGIASEKARKTRRLVQLIINSYPVALVVVSLTVLFLRPQDPDAWLLSLLFAGFIAVPNLAESLSPMRPLWRFVVAYNLILGNLVAPLFFFFFSVFPARSPLDVRLPWLKWSFLSAAACLIPFVFAGSLERGPAAILVNFFHYGVLALGLVSLAWNAVRASTQEARRKIRVILWGTLVGVVPAMLLAGTRDFLKFQPPLWFVPVVVILFWLFPLSFAYAIVKHRVMEIPVLLRRSARYVLVQRGFIVLLPFLWILATRLFVYALSGLAGKESNLVVGVSLAFAIALLWVAAPIVKLGTERIDRAFFRSAYDARVILEDLAKKTRTVSDRHDLAVLLRRHIEDALHPNCFTCYFEGSQGSLVAECETTPPALGTFQATMLLLPELMRRGKAWVIPPQKPSSGGESPGTSADMPECLVPVLGRSSQLLGLVALGQRRSEEPYSDEDLRLLDSVASQAGITLEVIQLGEKMAARLESDRRVAREMEIARQVQERLFPQRLPALKTLEYTGDCIPARAVGGDYYDFLCHRPGRLALVLADIAGKGVSAALLMANLQANLRSQYAMAVDDMPRLLASVNHLFCENTGEAGYTTLFFADYDDTSRVLRYANCGHLPPLLLSGDRTSVDEASEARRVEWLGATCTVVGIFRTWECEIAEVALVPGDTLVLYTDGITEAQGPDGEEFGESRLLDTINRHCHLPIKALRETVVKAVQQFSRGEQHDDITLVIARCLG